MAVSLQPRPFTLARLPSSGLTCKWPAMHHSGARTERRSSNGGVDRESSSSSKPGMLEERMTKLRCAHATCSPGGANSEEMLRIVHLLPASKVLHAQQLAPLGPPLAPDSSRRCCA